MGPQPTGDRNRIAVIDGGRPVTARSVNATMEWSGIGTGRTVEELTRKTRAEFATPNPFSTLSSLKPRQRQQEKLGMTPLAELQAPQGPIPAARVAEPGSP